MKYPNKPGYHHMLATCLTEKYQSNPNQIQCLLAALDHQQEAVTLTEKFGKDLQEDKDYPQQLEDLAQLFRHKHHEYGNLEDLETAIRHSRKACKIAPQPVNAHQILGAALTDLYWYSKNPEVLKEAQKENQKALDLDPENPQCLQNLAISFMDMYWETRDLNCLNKAVDKNLEAIKLLSPNTPSIERAPFVQNLAISFRERYEAHNDEQDLSNAVINMQNVVQLLPTDSPHRRLYLENLAQFLLSQYRATKNPEYLKDARHRYNESLGLHSPNVLQSWDAAYNWVTLEKEIGSLKKGQTLEGSGQLKAYSAAFDLLPIILGIEDSLTARQAAYKRIRITGAVSDAIRACIAQNNIGFAVEFAEKGMALTFKQQSKIRAQTNGHTKSEATESQKQRNYSDLYKVSAEGPVVILNSHSDSCDAIIILPPGRVPQKMNTLAEPAITIKLGITVDNLQKKKNNLKSCLRKSDSDRLDAIREPDPSEDIQEDLPSIVKWLWENIVSPIYSKLNSVSMMALNCLAQ
ncbi:hypothetical protein C8R44DRAFT_753345 [Mycena epipterygia]|nr:hypothetical protein C8R44DRAFT_753345 [Mycena epipterygia]